MRIKDIRASAHELPTHYPLIDGPRGTRAFAIAEVETEDGLVGYGLAAASSPPQSQPSSGATSCPPSRGWTPATSRWFTIG